MVAFAVVLGVGLTAGTSLTKGWVFSEGCCGGDVMLVLVLLMLVAEDDPIVAVVSVA